MPAWEELGSRKAVGGIGFPINTPEVQGEMDAKREIADAETRANAKAARLLAERECPETIKEWGRAHGFPAFAEMTWMDGFAAGLRVAELARTSRLEREDPAHG